MAADTDSLMDRMPRAPSLAQQEAARQAAQYTGRGVAAMPPGPQTSAGRWNTTVQPATANAQLQAIAEQRRQQAAGTLPGAREWVAEGQQLFDRAQNRTFPVPPVSSPAQRAARPVGLHQQIRQMQGEMFGGANAPGFLTQANLQDFSENNPLALAALAGGPIRHEDDVYGRMLGYGSRESPVAEQAMQQAMILAAERLIGQGYDLNEEAILNALQGGDVGYQYGDTVAGQDARMNPEPEPEPGLLTAAQRQEFKDEDMLAGRDERLTQQAQQAQAQQFAQQTGLEVPSGVPVEVAAAAFNSDRDREIQAWVVENASKMRQAGGMSVRELLMYEGMGAIGFDPADPIDYAVLAMMEQRLGG